ncbi:MAG: DUF1573 domain-containing protein [Bacteroidetes bacterium]|nr:DUF1573 domain-containing protein [Bacteroidota bacterium]
MNARFFLIMFVCASFNLKGQQSNPPADIRSNLKTLSDNEKLKLLEYMRHMGANLDKEVQHTYEQLNNEKRSRALLYIEMQKTGVDAITDRTTVKFTRDTVNFGEIEEGIVILDTFQFTNTGKAPYIIKEVKSSCDCTVLKRPDYPVMPGETSTLRVEFDSNGKAGSSQPGVIIYDNSIPNGRNIVYLKGSVVPRRKPKRPGGK